MSIDVRDPTEENFNIHFCSRCKEITPLSEWLYISKWHGWQHQRLFETMNASGVMVQSICGWTEKIPTKV